MKTLLITLTLGLSLNIYAADKAYQIAKKVEKANEGFLGENSEMEMVLISGDNEIKRLMKSQLLEVNDKESRTLLEFLLPKDVKGTKLLTWSFDESDDSQWIYMPAFNKIKRISSSSKSSSFMGSEFTYEDLRANSPEKYNHKFLSEESKGGDTLWKYERQSKMKSGYSKQVVYVSKKYMQAIKVEYFDRSGQMFKVATMSGFKPYKVKKKTYYRPTKIEMVNKQTKKSSIMNWNKRELGVKLSAREFSKKNLKQ